MLCIALLGDITKHSSCITSPPPQYTTFKNTYGKTESTSVLTTLSLYGDLVCKIDANKVQAKLDKICKLSLSYSQSDTHFNS